MTRVSGDEDSGALERPKSHRRLIKKSPPVRGTPDQFKEKRSVRIRRKAHPFGDMEMLNQV